MQIQFCRKDSLYFITKPSKPTKPFSWRGGSQPLAAESQPVGMAFQLLNQVLTVLQVL
jgi:hypothetical protein